MKYFTWNLKIEIGTLEPWNSGTLELWNPGTQEPWDPGTKTRLRKHKTQLTRERKLKLETQLMKEICIFLREN
jgi:hypothetical protein